MPSSQLNCLMTICHGIVHKGRASELLTNGMQLHLLSLKAPGPKVQTALWDRRMTEPPTRQNPRVVCGTLCHVGTKPETSHCQVLARTTEARCTVPP